MRRIDFSPQLDFNSDYKQSRVIPVFLGETYLLTLCYGLKKMAAVPMLIEKLDTQICAIWKTTILKDAFSLLVNDDIVFL